MDKVIEDTLKSVTKVSNFLKTKINELSGSAAQGPLAEARSELGKLKPKVSSATSSLEQLKKKGVTARKEYAKREQAEKTAHIEAREKKEADAILAAAAAQLEALEAASKALEETAAPLVSRQGSELEAFATPAAVQEATAKLVADATKKIAEAKASVKEQVSELSKFAKGPLVEAKKELSKTLAKLDLLGKKAKATSEACQKACIVIVEAKSGLVFAALRTEVQKRGVNLEVLFADLAGAGLETISEAAFTKGVTGLDGLGVSPEQASLVFQHIAEAGGVSKRRFLDLLEQYYVVVKAIAVTSEFDIAKGKTLRKAEIGEVVEVLEGPRVDEKLGLTRVKTRSLNDGNEGWITVRGNQGTPFLNETAKPYYECTEEVPLGREFKSDGSEPIRVLQANEVIEVLEGPRKETFSFALRARGKAASDGATGWFTVKDKQETVFAESDGKYYHCIAVVAITDSVDVKDCKVVRKLALDEVFLVEEGPIEDKESGISRVRGKAVKDGKEGWISIRGNGGTVYAEATTKHYTVLQEVPLHKGFATTGATEVRKLAKGEAVQVLEGPREEAFPPEMRVKGRAVTDGAVGWITVKGNVRPWSPNAKPAKAAAATDAASSEA